MRMSISRFRTLSIRVGFAVNAIPVIMPADPPSMFCPDLSNNMSYLARHGRSAGARPLCRPLALVRRSDSGAALFRHAPLDVSYTQSIGYANDSISRASSTVGMGMVFDSATSDSRIKGYKGKPGASIALTITRAPRQGEHRALMRPARHEST